MRKHENLTGGGGAKGKRRWAFMAVPFVAVAVSLRGAKFVEASFAVIIHQWAREG
ncbi:MAG: hypothetical protein J6333_08195 [Planctomycetes bacterium]|nr:hypothetical protein [Planctomycetota bacterium]